MRLKAVLKLGLRYSRTATPAFRRHRSSCPNAVLKLSMQLVSQTRSREIKGLPRTAGLFSRRPPPQLFKLRLEGIPLFVWDFCFCRCADKRSLWLTEHSGVSNVN